MEDNIPPEVKHQRAEEIMALQSAISYDLNQEKVGQTFKVLFDEEGQYFVGRTEFDSPDVDNEVLVEASTSYVRIGGDFAEVFITHADHFDLYGKLVSS